MKIGAFSRGSPFARRRTLGFDVMKYCLERIEIVFLLFSHNGCLTQSHFQDKSIHTMPPKSPRRDPNAPKRNQSAYLLYQNAMRNTFKGQNPGKPLVLGHVQLSIAKLMLTSMYY